MNLTSMNYVKFKRKIEIVRIILNSVILKPPQQNQQQKPSKRKQTELMKKDCVNELWKKR